MRLVLLTILVSAAGLTACGNRSAPPPAPEAPGISPEPVEEVMVMSGVDLFLHDTRPTMGRKQKPTFWVHADKFSQYEYEESVWVLEDARAVLYGETDEESIIFDARRGRFEQDKGAYLKDGVTAQVGTMTMHLQDIEWINPQEGVPGRAFTLQPVVVEDPALQLEAASLEIFPETKEFELSDVTGLVRFGRDVI